MKVTVCNLSGFPDLMLLKDGEVRFIEVKGKGGKLSELQKYRHEQLKKQGFNVETKCPS